MKFWKMSGAGNDFVMVDNRAGDLDEYLIPEKIAEICKRGMSVGADGLIELQSSTKFPFRMKYYNSDGKPADMCGNGARCIARFSQMFGLTSLDQPFDFESDAGVHRGLVTGACEARVWMTEPVLHYNGRLIKINGRDFNVGYADTGVPHAVVFSNDLLDGSFEEYSSLLRRHATFPQGANSNWLKIHSDGTLELRTYERGVEGETLACGTGAVAAALLASEKFEFVHLPVQIRVKSGLTLLVGQDPFGWWLQGEARIVYTGEYES